MAEGYKFHGKTQIRKWLKEALKPICKEYGFKVGTIQGCPTSFYKQTNDFFVYNIFQLSKGDFVLTGDSCLRINAIENKLSAILDKDLASYTIILNNSGLESFQIISEIEIRKLVAGFAEVFVNKHLPFIEKYTSEVGQVLELWDSLDIPDRAKTFYDPNMYSKILIASKLAGEDRFDHRVDDGINYFDTRIEAGKNAFIERKENFLKVADYLRKENLT